MSASMSFWGVLQLRPGALKQRHAVSYGVLRLPAYVLPRRRSLTSVRPLTAPVVPQAILTELPHRHTPERSQQAIHEPVVSLSPPGV
jgi:hypothetical protein